MYKYKEDLPLNNLQGLICQTYWVPNKTADSRGTTYSEHTTQT